MLQRIQPRWDAKLATLRASIPGKEAELAAATDADEREKLSSEFDQLVRQADWMQGTIIEIIISEAQNEVRDFAKRGFDIIPHRVEAVNEAIRAQAHGDDQAEGLKVDLSQIDFEKLREEFAKKVRHKRKALHDIRDLVEKSDLDWNTLRSGKFFNKPTQPPSISS